MDIVPPSHVFIFIFSSSILTLTLNLTRDYIPALNQQNIGMDLGSSLQILDLKKELGKGGRRERKAALSSSSFFLPAIPVRLSKWRHGQLRFVH